MARLYFYKLVADNGGAPHVTPGLLSLAICKPMIRRTAREGDWIFGFAANSLDADNRLIYVARVTQKLVDGAYYRDASWRSRGDCIYEHRDGTYHWRAGAKHHGGKGDLEHDLGPAPDHRSAQVLLSDDFRYFGATGDASYKLQFPRVKEAVERLGRGHRVNHGNLLRDQLLEMKDELWSRTTRRKLGRPSGKAECGVCHRDGEVEQVDEINQDGGRAC